MYTARNLEDAMAAPEETAELFLVGQGYNALPEEVFKMPNLRLLDLSQNQLNSFPAELGFLSKLEVLVARGNQLWKLPPEIGQLQHLLKLDLEKNDLESLPDELQHCEALRELRLSDNLLEVWPAAALPPQLDSIVMARNKLRLLPDSIRNFVQLQYLDLSDNRLRQLPGGLILLAGLKHLQLAGNPLGMALPSADPEVELERIFKELQRSKASQGDRLRWFRLVQGDATLLEDEAPYQLAAALDSPVVQVRAAAKTLLPQWFPSPLPAKGPAKLLFAGTVTGKSKYQRDLTAAGFEILLRAAPGSIVVLGDRPGQAAQLAYAAGLAIAFEGHVEAWHKQSQGEFLTTKATAAANMVASLRRLLRSYRKENIEMALVMMSRAGTPQELLSELLVIKLFHDDLDVRTQAEEAFTQLAEKPLIAFVNRQVEQHYKLREASKLPHLVEALLRNPGVDAAALIDGAVSLAGGGIGLGLLLPEDDRTRHFQNCMKDGKLDLSSLHLSTFPPWLAGVTGLRYLGLGRNQLKALPVDLSAFVQLEMLDLADNALTVLPDSVGLWRKVKSLDLSRNRLQALPETLGEMAALEALRLDHNPLLNLPTSLLDLPRLEMLGLYGCKFALFPDVVWQMSGLQSLELGECNLQALPDTIAGFPHLERLSLRDNPVAQLPDWLGALPALRFLDLSFVAARALPQSLHGHPRLERLFLIRDESMDWEVVLPILASMPRLQVVYFRGRKMVRAIQLMIEETLPRVRIYMNG